MHMKRPLLVLLLAAGALPSCRTTHDAAVATFRVIDAPHQYIRRKLDVDEDGQTTTTTSTTTVETNAPGYGQPSQQPYEQPFQHPPPQYVGPPPPPPPPQQRAVVTQRTREPEPTATPQPRVTSRSSTTRSGESEKAETRSSPTPRTASSEKSSLPYAKPVPGKPGYVFSPYDKNGGYVDVTGFAPGSKVKDPYSGKVFLVP